MTTQLRSPQLERREPLVSPNRLTLLLATVLTGMSAGFFFTYEASVTLALGDVGDAAYVETFQAINRTVRNPAFGIVFFGSVPAIALALVANWSTAGRLPRILMVTALPFYLAGVLVTGTGNVPLNEELASVELSSPDVAGAARAEFENEWNDLNLIRSLAIGASFISLVGSGILLAEQQRPHDVATPGQTADQ